jgi:hypothetical protein
MSWQRLPIRLPELARASRTAPSSAVCSPGNRGPHLRACAERTRRSKKVHFCDCQTPGGGGGKVARTVPVSEWDDPGLEVGRLSEDASPYRRGGGSARTLRPTGISFRGFGRRGWSVWNGCLPWGWIPGHGVGRTTVFWSARGRAQRRRRFGRARRGKPAHSHQDSNPLCGGKMLSRRDAETQRRRTG